LEHNYLLLCLACLSFFLMIRVYVLDTHGGTVQGGMRDGFDGCLVLNNGGDISLSSSSGYSVGTSGAHSQGNNAEGPAYSHAPDHISLTSVIGGSELVEVSLNDVALLACVVDRRRSQADANHGD